MTPNKITKKDFLESINTMLELPKGTLQGNEFLSQLAAWDSLALIGFIALVDSKFGKTVSGSSIAQCKTVNDLIALADENL